MREGGCRLEGERVKAETSWRLDITERTFVMMKQKIQKEQRNDLVEEDFTVPGQREELMQEATSCQNLLCRTKPVVLCFFYFLPSLFSFGRAGAPHGNAITLAVKPQTQDPIVSSEALVGHVWRKSKTRNSHTNGRVQR